MSDIVQLPPGSTEAAKSTQQLDAEKAKSQQGAQNQSSQRPEHIPEKFWKDGKVDTDALVKSYTELEKARSGKELEKKEVKPAEQVQTEPTDESFKPFYEEFAKDGKLSEESYKKLAEQHKLPKAIVDSFIADRVARQTQETETVTREVFDLVGGQENYTKTAEWARDNLAAEDIAAFNSVLESGNKAQIKLAVAGLHARFTAAEGRPAATRLRGDGGRPTVTAFRSMSEVAVAMSDPRYATDPSYRDEVAERLRVSDI